MIVKLCVVIETDRYGGVVACHVNDNLSYNTLSVFPLEIKNILFEILLPNSKPVTAGTIYFPPRKVTF